MEKPKKSNIIQFRMTDEERERLQAFADARGWSMAQVLRELVRTLPTDNEKITLFG